MQLSFPWGPCRRRSSTPLFIDAPSASIDELNHYFDVQDRITTVLGGYGLLTQAFSHFSRRWEKGRALSVLQLQCGRGDWAEHLLRWAHRRKEDLSILAIDSDPRKIDLARNRWSDKHGCLFEHKQLNDASLFQAQQVDYVVSAMDLSCYSQDQAVCALKKINLLARRGFVVIDGLRDLRRWLAISLLLGIFPDVSCSVDAAASVKKSFSVSETQLLLKRSGLELVRLSFPAGLWSLWVYERALAEAPKYVPVVGWAGA